MSLRPALNLSRMIPAPAAPRLAMLGLFAVACATPALDDDADTDATDAGAITPAFGQFTTNSVTTSSNSCGELFQLRREVQDAAVAINEGRREGVVLLRLGANDNLPNIDCNISGPYFTCRENLIEGARGLSFLFAASGEYTANDAVTLTLSVEVDCDGDQCAALTECDETDTDGPDCSLFPDEMPCSTEVEAELTLSADQSGGEDED